jgi:hypothetical protein
VEDSHYERRFDSALRLDVHFHALVLDGVYTGFDSDQPLTFHPATPLQDEEVQRLVRHIQTLICGQLSRRGCLDDEGKLDPESGTDLDVLSTCHAAAIQGLIPFGSRSGLPSTLCSPDAPAPSTPRPTKKLCADHLGFSLHAAVRIGNGTGARSRLERLCRYVTRPPFAQDRLSIANDGDIVYRFRHPWRNGKTAVRMDPMTFLARLAAQIPTPRRHTIVYHGVLAAAAAKRDQIVPEPPESAEQAPHRSTRGTDKSVNQRVRIRPGRYSWSALLQRTFLIDILTCPCGARRRVLSLVCDPAEIHRCLSHLGLPTTPPQRAPPRPMPRALPLV